MVVTVIVDDCCHLMELKARNARTSASTQQFEKNLPRLLADERAVRRRLHFNLLSNAVKFRHARHRSAGARWAGLPEAASTFR